MSIKMTAFAAQEYNGNTVWHGAPDCDAAHQDVLAWLTETGQPFLEPGVNPTTNVFGNVGELIAFRIGRERIQTNGGELVAHAPNVDAPLIDRSRDGVDIVWLHFAEHPSGDWVVLQEVKATADPGLGHAATLLNDYQKLFGTDPRLTLRSRLNGLKAWLSLQLDRPQLATRLTGLGGSSPSEATRVRVLPTFVHEASTADPAGRMVLIRQSMLGLGWPDEAIYCWAVGLEDFATRIDQLVHGG